jgi:hypothetical protein
VSAAASCLNPELAGPYQRAVKGSSQAQQPLVAPSWAWPASHLPLLLPLAPDPACLANERLLVVLRSGSSDGAILGQSEIAPPAVRPEAADGTGAVAVVQEAESHFCVHVTKSGRLMGQLSGVVRLSHVRGLAAGDVADKAGLQRRAEVWASLMALEESTQARRTLSIERQAPSRVSELRFNLLA